MRFITDFFVWLIDGVFAKRKRAYVLKTTQIFAEGLSIFSFIVMVLISFTLFGAALYRLVISMNAHDFVKNLLSSFELLFIAPIPLLVVFSFKRYIIKMFPLEIHLSQLERDHLMDEVVAKKIFISSMIGVIATFTLGLFIEAMSTDHHPDHTFLTITSTPLISILVIVLMMLFLLILIYYYKVLSNHHAEK